MEWYKQFYSKKFMDLVGFASEEQTCTEVNFIQRTLNLSQGAKVLDLCCGYGRHTKLLADLCKWEMTGLDLSEDYLSIARNNYAGSHINYLKGDMRNLPFRNQFDAALNLFTSFGFFESEEENEKVLQQVHNSLKRNGLFLLDYENKFYFIENDVRKKSRYWKSDKNGTYYLIENNYDVINEREVFNVSVIENGEIRETTGYNIRLYSFPEISKMLSKNGFEVEQFWGGYEYQAYSVNSKRIIILSRRR